MGGIDFTFYDFMSFIVPLLITIYCITANNPYEHGSKENESLRLCRIGIGFTWWGWGFGLFGIIFSLIGIIFGIIGIVKDRTTYGIWIIIIALFTPILNFITFIRYLQ